MENGKWNAFLAAAYEAALQAGDLAADAVYGLRREVERQTAAMRGKRRAARLEQEVDGKLREVGQMIYATHTGHPTDSDVLEEKLREVDGLKAGLEDLNGAAVCPLCGGAVRTGDRFCRACGGRL